MPTYVFQALDGSQIEEVFTVASCPKSLKRGGKVYRKILAPLAGFKMEAETNSPLYQQWFHSEPVQAKLKSGEYVIAGKDSNINQY